MQKLINSIEPNGKLNLTPSGQIFQSQINSILLPVIQSFEAQGFDIIEMERILTNLILNQ